MNIPTALAVLKDAVDRSYTDDVGTPEVHAALEYLDARATIKWPFEQFRKAPVPGMASSTLTKKGGDKF